MSSMSLARLEGRIRSLEEAALREQSRRRILGCPLGFITSRTGEILLPPWERKEIHNSWFLDTAGNLLPGKPSRTQARAYKEAARKRDLDRAEARANRTPEEKQAARRLVDLVLSEPDPAELA